MKLRHLVVFTSITLAGCGSEYGPSELEVSENGAFVERGSTSLIDGTVVIEKVTGESLTVEFEDGLPNGEVDMRNADGDPILQSNFVAKLTEEGGGLGLLGSVNQVLESDAGSLKTDDYLDLFEGFSEYNGSYFQIDRNNRKIQGNYTNGERTGRWQEHCENGQLESDRTYKQVSKDGKENIIKVGKELMNRCDGEVLLAATRDDKGRLQGKYTENASAGFFSRSTDTSEKPKPKYQRNYKDGELDGEQKEFNRYGLIQVENQFSEGVKTGPEKIYASNQNYSTKEVLNWLSEVKQYSNGQLNGKYVHYDSLNRVIESGQHQNDSPVGLWFKHDYKNHKRQLVDYDSSNFTLEKAKAFKQACSLPDSSWNTINWGSNRQGSLSDCEYYVENAVVDINKKIALDAREPFKESSNWTYPAVVAAPKTYEYMKNHGLKTRVSDSVGRTRLHICLDQLRSQNKNYPRCNARQAISYIDEVDINSVSNIGTALHQIAYRRNYSSRRANVITAELSIAKALIESGANIDQLNHKRATALMDALSNAEYGLAELLLDAGASVDDTDIQERGLLSHFFINANSQWRKKKVGAQGTRVLAKMIALGTDTSAPIWNAKTVKELSEENNTLHHLETLKNANAMSLDFSDKLKTKAQQRQQALTEPKQTGAKHEINNAPLNEQLAGHIVEPNSTANIQKPAHLEVPTDTNNTAVQETSPEPVLQDPLVTDENQLTSTGAVSSVGEPSRAEALLQEQADFLVSQANDHIANFRLKTPKNNSALGSLEQLKRIDPQNSNISLIEKSIGEKYLSLASQKIKKSEKAAAQKHLNSASEFIDDQAVLDDYSSRIAAIKRKPASNVNNGTSANRTQTTSVSKTTNSSGLSCNTRVKAIGLPLLGRTLIARQSLPLSKQAILDKAAVEIQREYNNIRRSNNQITFEQPSSGKPVKFTLEVQRDGNNTQLSVTAKTPPGLVITRANYKTAFCELISKL